MIDRSEVNRALSKAIAYKQCGRDESAAAWAARLVELLGSAEILDTEWSGWRAEKQYLRIIGEIS